MTSYDSIIEGLAFPDSVENVLMEELADEHNLSIESDFEQLVALIQNRLSDDEIDEQYGMEMTGEMP